MRQPYPMPGDPPVDLCPLRPFRDDPGLELRVSTLHHHWLKGIMPERGGLADQACAYAAVMISVEAGLEAGKAARAEIAARGR